MSSLLNSTEHVFHAGLISKAVLRLEHRIREAFENRKQQKDAWERFHKTAAGRHVPCRTWMRHGAMLEVISRKRG
jgi:hypothetical protein